MKRNNFTEFLLAHQKDGNATRMLFSIVSLLRHLSTRQILKHLPGLLAKKLKSQVNQSNLKNLMSHQSLPELPAINQTRNSEKS